MISMVRHFHGGNLGPVSFKIAQRQYSTLNPKSKIVVLTGAGLSVASGLPTFRGTNNLRDHPDALPFTTADELDYFTFRDNFLKEYSRAALIATQIRNRFNIAAEPNIAHQALATAQKRYEHFKIFTTNIDNLSSRAGCQEIRLHGTLEKVQCAYCRSIQPWQENIDLEDITCDYCGKGTSLPDVVFFDEKAQNVKELIESIQQADIYIEVGIHPQNSLGPSSLIRENKDLRAVRINTASHGVDRYFTDIIGESAEEAFQKIFDSPLENLGQVT